MLRNSLLILLIFLSSNSSLFSKDWTRWRGPDANSISLEADWNPKALNDLKIKWRVNIGYGHGSIVSKGNFIYCTGNRISKTSEKMEYEDIVTCLEIHSGKIVWQFSFPCSQGDYPGPRATPAIDGNSLFTLSSYGDLHCLDLKTGSVMWIRQLVSEGLAKKPLWGFCGSPVIQGNLLIVNAGSMGIAFHKLTGRVIWKSDFETGTLTTPVLFEAEGKKLAAIPSGRALYAVNIENGTKEWWYPWYKDMDIDPLMNHEILVIPGYSGIKTIQIDGSKHQVIMENRKIQFNAYQNSVLMNHFVYGYSKKGKLQCVNIHTGEIQWDKNLGSFGSISAADNKLIILTGDGKLLILEASAEKYSMISESQIFKKYNNNHIPEDKKWRCWTQPVLSGGNIYVRSTHGDLVCVDMRK